jgi:Mg2+/citrate symporter
MTVIIKVGAESGLSATKITAMMIAGRVMGTGLCLTTPSVYLGLGMMGLNYKDAFMRLAKWSFIIGEILVIFTGIVVQ